MNPLRLHARGYRTFDELDLEIPAGCTAVVGPNGAGKSSILNVVDVALFAKQGELNDLLSTDHDELELGLEFEHAGDVYRVRRQLRRGKSATLDLERAFYEPEAVNDTLIAWEPLTRERVDATQALICETLGLTRATFRASAFLRQGDSAAFTEAAPRDRKAILAEILRLERWEQRREQAAAGARGQDTELTKLAGRAELAELTAKLRPEVERALETLRLRDQEAAALVASIERTVEERQRQIAETAAAKERIRACEAELQTATSDEHRVRDRLLEAQQAQAAMEGKQAELDGLTKLAADQPRLAAEAAAAREQHEKAAGAERSRDDLLASSARHRDAATRLRTDGDRLASHHRLLADRLLELQQAEDGAKRCDRCEQILGAEAKAAAISSLQRELDELEQRVAQTVNEAIAEERLTHETAAEAGAIQIPIVPDLARIEADLVRARDAQTRMDGVQQLLVGYREKTAKLPLLESELTQLAGVTAAKRVALDEATAAAGDGAGLERQLAAVRNDLTRARVTLEEIRRTVAQQEAQLQAVVDAETELAEILLKRKEIQAEFDTLKLAERAFGRDGIPALLVEAVAVPQLEAEANRILEQLPMADGRTFHVELQTQAANKSNDNVRETLEILVYDRGAARPYETYSGGEKTRLNLALRLALSQLLAHRRGAESRLLCIDEPDGLDAAAMDALADVLQGLVGTFERILIVSHQVELASAFEQSLTVSCEHGRSRVDAAQLEAAIA